MNHLSFWSALLCSAFAFGCQIEPPVACTVRIDRVLMHEPNRFTFLVRQNDGVVGQLSTKMYSPSDNAIIRDDVPAGEKMWVEFVRVENCATCTCESAFNSFSTVRMEVRSLTIHIHRVDEISGAGWNHGKFGRGQTTVIE